MMRRVKFIDGKLVDDDRPVVARTEPKRRWRRMPAHSVLECTRWIAKLSRIPSMSTEQIVELLHSPRHLTRLDRYFLADRIAGKPKRGRGNPSKGDQSVAIAADMAREMEAHYRRHGLRKRKQQSSDIDTLAINSAIERLRFEEYVQKLKLQHNIDWGQAIDRAVATIDAIGPSDLIGDKTSFF
jgi:hypothetical protein